MKDYQKKEIKYYIFANLLLLLYLVEFDLSMISINEIILRMINFGVISGFIGVLIFIVDSLFSSEFKTSLLYLWGNLPGCTVFSEIRKGDYDDIRFLKDDALKLYKDIYDNMPISKEELEKYENSCWYRIYNCYRDKEIVRMSNRDYLFCRDVFTTTLINLIVYVICLFALCLEFSRMYILYLIVMLVVTNISARIKAKKLIYHVIAIDIHTRIKL